MELIQTIEDWAWIGWLVLILLFLVIEMLTLDFTFLMLSIGGVAGLASDLLGAPIWLQVVIAAVDAAILVLVLRPPLLRRLRRGEDPTPSNVDALVGLAGRVLSTVSTDGGQVKLSNGDIWTAGDALAMVERTGCAGVVVGRACLGRPWFFGQLDDVFAGRDARPEPPLGEVAAIAADHARLLVEAIDEDRGVRMMRKHLAWYLTGFPVGPAARTPRPDGTSIRRTCADR